MANVTNSTKRSVIEATTAVHLTGGVLTLDFLGGQQLIVDSERLSPEIRAHALMHGLKQKLVDAAAISRNTETGKPATPDDKYEAVKAVWARITSPDGTWNATREGGGNAGGLLLRALVRLYDGKKSPEDIKAFLDGKTDAEKTALRKNPRVAAIIEEIRAETGKPANIDTDSMLGELEG